MGTISMYVYEKRERGILNDFETSFCLIMIEIRKEINESRYQQMINIQIFERV